MPWTCPTCGKEFKNRNQFHSCATVSLDKHFQNKLPHVRETFDALLKEVRALGKVVVNPVKTSIQLRAATTFLSVKAKTDHLQIEFALPKETLESPVYKTVWYSKSLVLHSAVLERPADVDRRLMRWIKQSYTLANK